MKYKSIVSILLCCFFFAGNSNYVAAKPTVPQPKIKQRINWNNIKKNIELKLNKILDNKYANKALEVSAAVAIAIPSSFAIYKLNQTEFVKSMNNAIMNSNSAFFKLNQIEFVKSMNSKTMNSKAIAMAVYSAIITFEILCLNSLSRF